MKEENEIAIHKLADKEKPAMTANLEPEFLRSADVAALFNISNSTLKNFRQAHIIPYYKVGGTYLYRRNEILEYLERQRIDKSDSKTKLR